MQRTWTSPRLTAALDPERPLWMQALDVSAVGALVCLLAIASLRLAVAASAGGAWWVLVPALVGAVLCADMVSGVVHWIGDRFFSERTPLLGPMLIRPFREHHRDPLAITRHGFFELCGNNALAVLVPVLLLVWAGAPDPGAASLLGYAFVLFFALAVFATNQFHKWAHAAQIARPVRWLQASGLILSPAGHARHHGGDFAQGYCVTTGWMNPPLDAVRLLPLCEAGLRRVGRAVRGGAPARVSSPSSRS